MTIDPQILVQLEAAIERCGVPSADVQISYEDDLQSDEIRVSSRGLSDEQILCLQRVEATPPYPIVTFEDGQVFARNHELRQLEAQQEARAWLGTRGKLESLPTFDPAEEHPIEFARRIEAYCGIEPGTALQFDEHLRVITPNLGWLGQPLRRGWLWRKLHRKKHDEQFEFLLKTMAASDDKERGIKFGFIGNEYVVDKERP